MTNEEKYKTPEERLAAFMGYCDRHREKFNGCTIGNCPLRTTSTRACPFFWLTLEAEEEKPLACPFCGSEAQVVIVAPKGAYVHCKECGAFVAASSTKAEAIAAWNRRAK
jgi:Lar family restriction alleviation protein